MDLIIFVGVMIALAAPFVIYSLRKDSGIAALRAPVVNALGARYDNEVIRGEKEGVKFQIALLSRVTMVNPVSLVSSMLTSAAFGFKVDVPKNEIIKGLSTERFVVRAKVPGLLPLGLIGMPSRWFSRSPRGEASGGLSGDPELEKLYFFRTNDPEKTQRLLGDAEVQQALKTLMTSSPGGGLVFDDCVNMTFNTDTYPEALESPEDAQRCVDTVVQVALVLDRVHNRIKEEADAAGLT
jgi:hypothetical protein